METVNPEALHDALVVAVDAWPEEVGDRPVVREGCTCS